MSNFLNNPNVKRSIKAITLATALTLGSSACSSDEKPRGDAPTAVVPEKQSSTTRSTLVYGDIPEKGTTTIPKNTTTTLPEKGPKLSAAESYVVSAERNQDISAKVYDAGARIVAAAESGVMGPFDFYNFQTEDWGRGAGNEGWGMLQHNPQYGGSEDQVSVMVYQDATGNVDLTKGVKSLMFRDPNGSVEFTTPGGIFSVFDLEGPVTSENSWKVRVATHEDIAAGNPVGNESSEFTAYDTSLVDLQIVDYTADSLLRVFMETHEL